MNERNDERLDHELSGIAMAAALEHERMVSAHEVESALEAVRSRAAAGDLGGSPPSVDRGSNGQGRQRSAWVLVGAAAAVVAILGAGLVALVGDGPDDVLVPATVPTLAPAPTVVPTTIPDEPGVATTTAPVPVERRTLSVDAANPPRLVEPVPYASVPLAPNPNGQSTEFAVGLDHVILNQPGTGTFTVVGPDVDGVSVREVAVDEEVGPIVSGPGPVVYGFGDPAFDDNNQAAPRGLRVVAIPFLGDREGDVVAVEEVDINRYLELPPLLLGHGPNGVIDRGRIANDTVIGYVDQNGVDRDSGESSDVGVPFPLFDVERVDGTENVLIVDRIGSSVGWELDITRDAAHTDTYVGDGPVAAGLQRAIFTTRIGANTTPDEDFGNNLMPVVALMNPDGSGEWIRLPDDWDVVASDVWGTLLARFTDDAIELASLDDLVPPPERGFEPVETDAESANTPSTTGPAVLEPVLDSSASDDLPAVERQCVTEFDCTSVALTEDGRIVTLDPVGLSLRVHDFAGENVLIDQPIAEVLDDVGPELVTVGPDDVAYIRTFPRTGTESAGELLAVPLDGPQAGAVVRRSTGLPVSGGTAVEPRRSGLAIFLCCGNVSDGTFPRPDVRIAPWVDRDGNAVESGAPSFELAVGDAGNSLTRVDAGDDQVRQSFQLPAAVGTPQGFPDVVAADDGGALASYVSVALDAVILVDMDPDWPRNRVDNSDVYYVPISEVVGAFTLEPSGTVIASSDDGFVRRTLHAFATAGWAGSPETDVDTGSTSAPGLNEHIEENQPFWADEPTLFAHQIAQTLGPNEQVAVEFDESEEPVITITTTGLLDDSTAAVRRVVTTERADDGLLRFVSSTYGWRCQPGRGHQDYSTELCI